MKANHALGNLRQNPRNSLYEDGEDVHICVWPGNASVTHNLPQFAAHEGRVWCASVCGLLSMQDIPKDFEFYDDLVAKNTDIIFAGGSMIVSPQGAVVAEIAPGVEGVVAHEVDMPAIRTARHNFDPAGHYARSDIFRVTVQRHRSGDNFREPG